MSAADPVPARAPHVVQLYQSEQQLAETAGDFLADGLLAGDVAIAIATPAHRLDLLARMRGRGVDLERVLGDGRLVLLDAHETLARFMVDGSPDPGRFRLTVDGAIASAVAARPLGQARAFGEMVDILWRAGNPAAALRLEALWNDLLCERSLALLCSYAMGSFTRSSTDPALVCAAHSAVLAVEVSAPAAVAELAPAALPAPGAGHPAAGGDGERRTRRLLTMTAAIADAITGEQVFAAIVDQLGAAIGASSAALFLATADGGDATLARAVGYTDLAQARLGVLAAGAPRFPVGPCLGDRQPLWLDDPADLAHHYPDLTTAVASGRCRRAACLPISAQGTVLAALVVTFDDDAPLDDDERGFLLLVARYGGQALERRRLLAAERRATATAEDAARRAELLHDLARRVIAASRVDDVYPAALDAVARTLSADRAAILTVDGDGVMRFRAWRGLSEDYRAAALGHPPWPRTTRDPRPITVAGTSESLRAEGIAALTFVPLVAGDRLLGALGLYFDAARDLDADQLDVARAIADHVAAAITRFAALAELRDSIRFHDTFTGILGHDLRSPLTAIATAAELALGRSADMAMAKPLSRILASTGRMARMIDQLLDFTRARVGSGIPVRPTALDLAALARQIVEELEDAHPETRIRLRQHGDTAGGWDGDRLGQVFSNLIGNAIQHGAGAVEVVLDGWSADFVRIEVHNPGAIGPEVLPRIFEPLARGERSADRSQSLGLGLYITREIVKAHGGAIDVVSTPARGTTFLILLPRQPSSAA